MAKTIKILETFSGIGAQNKAITNINSKRGKKIFDRVATDEWDAWANLSYSAIHHDLNPKYEEILIKNSLVTEHDINVFLNKFNISLNSKSGSRIKSKNLLFKKYLAASILLSDNQVDITKLNPNILKEKDIDLVTYKFPCQG
nr:hypothetical protein [Mycoplasmopsis canis]